MNYAYIAGFFDGEGCIYKTPRGSYTMQMTQSAKQDAVLHQISAFLAADGVTNQITPARQCGLGQPSRHLKITKSSSMERCLAQMLPYLIVKRDAALPALLYVQQTIVRLHARDVRSAKWVQEYTAGDSCPTIARRYGVTVHAVNSLLHRRNVTMRDRDTARRLFKPSPEFLEARRADFRRATLARWGHN
jgi:hypothetical protein